MRALIQIKHRLRYNLQKLARNNQFWHIAFIVPLCFMLVFNLTAVCETDLTNERVVNVRIHQTVLSVLLLVNVAIHAAHICSMTNDYQRLPPGSQPRLPRHMWHMGFLLFSCFFVAFLYSLLFEVVLVGYHCFQYVEIGGSRKWLQFASDIFYYSTLVTFMASTIAWIAKLRRYQLPHKQIQDSMLRFVKFFTLLCICLLYVKLNSVEAVELIELLSSNENVTKEIQLEVHEAEGHGSAESPHDEPHEHLVDGEPANCVLSDLDYGMKHWIHLHHEVLMAVAFLGAIEALPLLASFVYEVSTQTEEEGDEPIDDGAEKDYEMVETTEVDVHVIYLDQQHKLVLPKMTRVEAILFNVLSVILILVSLLCLAASLHNVISYHNSTEYWKHNGLLNGALRAKSILIIIVTIFAVHLLSIHRDHDEGNPEAKLDTSLMYYSVPLIMVYQCTNIIANGLVWPHNRFETYWIVTGVLEVTAYACETWAFAIILNLNQRGRRRNHQILGRFAFTFAVTNFLTWIISFIDLQFAKVQLNSSTANFYPTAVWALIVIFTQPGSYFFNVHTATFNFNMFLEFVDNYKRK